MVIWGRRSQLLILPPSEGLNVGTVTIAVHEGNRVRTHIPPVPGSRESPRHHRAALQVGLANCQYHHIWKSLPGILWFIGTYARSSQDILPRAFADWMWQEKWLPSGSLSELAEMTVSFKHGCIKPSLRLPRYHLLPQLPLHSRLFYTVLHKLYVIFWGLERWLST